MGIIRSLIKSSIKENIAVAGLAFATAVLEKPINKLNRKRKIEDEKLISSLLSEAPNSQILRIYSAGENYKIYGLDDTIRYTGKFVFYSHGLCSYLRKMIILSPEGKYIGSSVEQLPKKTLGGNPTKHRYDIDLAGKKIGSVYDNCLDYLGLHYNGNEYGRQRPCNDGTLYSQSGNKVARIIRKEFKSGDCLVWIADSRNELIILMLAMTEMEKCHCLPSLD